MKICFVLILGVLFTLSAQAINSMDLIEQVELAEIRQTLNTRDLLNTKKHFQAVRVLYAACGRQVSGQLVPFACYELRSMVSGDSPLAIILVPADQLEKACRDGVAKLTAHQLDTAILPAGECRSAVENRLHINSYKRGL